MAKLLELQRDFVRAILAGQDGSIAGQIVAGALSSAQRLAIYRNNTHANLRGALQATYPVVLRLVDEPFFNHAADLFIAANPSRSGDLNDYGAAFPAFLEGYPPAVELAYLADVARLEWLWQQAFYAGHPAPLDVMRLASISPERFADLGLCLHPACGLLESVYPVLHIWQVNQAEFAGDPLVNLAEGGERLLVTRREYAVDIERLAAGEFAFLQRVAAHARLGDALDRALAADQTFDLQACLARRVQMGDIIDFAID